MFENKFGLAVGDFEFSICRKKVNNYKIELARSKIDFSNEGIKLELAVYIRKR
ncbi:MAG: hypothetical protein NTX22_01715 [Ignavibacteriales bacterium]|nr:hypothetical protein [Ignavibacteriales bacterium]